MTIFVLIIGIAFSIAAFLPARKYWLTVTRYSKFNNGNEFLDLSMKNLLFSIGIAFSLLAVFVLVDYFSIFLIILILHGIIFAFLLLIAPIHYYLRIAALRMRKNKAVQRLINEKCLNKYKISVPNKRPSFFLTNVYIRRWICVDYLLSGIIAVSTSANNMFFDLIKGLKGVAADRFQEFYFDNLNLYSGIFIISAIPLAFAAASKHKGK